MNRLLSLIIPLLSKKCKCDDVLSVGSSARLQGTDDPPLFSGSTIPAVCCANLAGVPSLTNFHIPFTFIDAVLQPQVYGAKLVIYDTIAANWKMIGI